MYNKLSRLLEEVGIEIRDLAYVEASIDLKHCKAISNPKIVLYLEDALNDGEDGYDREILDEIELYFKNNNNNKEVS